MGLIKVKDHYCFLTSENVIFEHLVIFSFGTFTYTYI